MNILIIGGSGFVSGTAARLAVAAGHHVHTLSRGNKPVAAGCVSLIADRRSPDDFARALQAAGTQWDLVIDCIGYAPQDAQQDLDILPALARHLVFISTDFVIEPHDRPPVIDETFDRFTTAGYGLAKRQCEVILLANASAMPVTILRPNHILGPGSQLGCLPNHGRDPQLIQRILDRQPLSLVGGGYFIQQPTFVDDIFHMAISCANNTASFGQIYFAPGPDTVTSRAYYQIIAELLDRPVTFEEPPVQAFLDAHPDKKPFCCHRMYRTDKARSHRLAIPQTPLRVALQRQIAALRNT